MTATFLLVVTAVSGYFFSDRCLRYKYILPREDGQRLYLRSLVYGLPFLILCLLISKLTFWLPGHFESIPAVFEVDSETETYLVAGGMFFISHFTAAMYNLAIGERGRKQKFVDAMKRDDFERILYESMENLQPIAISLDSRKVYVGLVYDGIEPDTSRSYLTIIPFLSGYRDPETLAFTIQSKYEAVIAALDSEGKAIDTETVQKYCMTVPRDKVLSLHLYNDHLYAQVQQQLA